MVDLRAGDVVDRIPKAFAAATTTLFTPLMLALAGIVLRGADFAFRKYAATFGQARLFGAMFAGSSLITPFFFGTVAGALASGRVPARRVTVTRSARGSIRRRWSAVAWPSPPASSWRGCS